MELPVCLHLDSVQNFLVPATGSHGVPTTSMLGEIVEHLFFLSLVEVEEHHKWRKIDNPFCSWLLSFKRRRGRKQGTMWQNVHAKTQPSPQLHCNNVFYHSLSTVEREGGRGC